MTLQNVLLIPSHVSATCCPTEQLSVQAEQILFDELVGAAVSYCHEGHLNKIRLQTVFEELVHTADINESGPQVPQGKHVCLGESEKRSGAHESTPETP